MINSISLEPTRMDVYPIVAEHKCPAVALAMDEEGIPVNDLYTAVLPDHPRYWTAPNNIHFNGAGSAFMGRRVANAVLEVLGREEPP